MTLQRLAVVGAGSMGAQIAQQAALGGIAVTLHDSSAEQLEKAAVSNRGHTSRPPLGSPRRSRGRNCTSSIRCWSWTWSRWFGAR